MTRDQMPWDAATDDPRGVAPRISNAPRWAAVAVWVTAAVQLVVFGGCALMFTAAGLLPAATLRDELSGQVPEEQLDQLIQGQPIMLGIAAGLTLVMFLPALALLLQGFGVRRLSTGAIRAARVILWIQATVVALVLVLYMLGGLTSGDVAAACFSGLLLGGLLALIVWTLRSLGAARRESTVRHGYDNEPWNEPMA